METFDFPYHTPTHVYPKGDGFKFGRGYQFNAARQLPVQRTFTLHFNSMVWFKNGAGNYDATVNPQLNMKALVDFYERHYTDKDFIYPHDVYGNLTVRFSADEPFQIPKSKEGGSGATEDFTLVIIEQG